MSDCCPLCGSQLDQTVDTLKLDADARLVTRFGKVVRLAGREFSTFECLFRAKGRVVSHGVILDYVYGLDCDEPDRSNLNVAVMKLRRKLKPLGVFISCQWGIGYALGVEK